MAALPEIKSPIVAAIERAYVEGRDDEERGYLGASILGHECERRLWYAFRWATPPEQFDGRMLRLFSTGHREEARLIADLRAAGMDVSEGEDGQQWRISFANGHGGGSADGIVGEVPGAEKTMHLLECKSHNDKSFKQLKQHGVKVSKPVHWAQMQIYMHGLGLTRALYLAVNKNDDEIHAERIEYDPAAALRLVAKAERVVAAHTPPARISDKPDWFECRFCPSHAACHDGEFARRNCRTCLHSSPIDGGAWRCDRFDRLLSIEEQRAGCSSHLYLPGLVAGEQIDADEGTVTYRLPDGGEWRDGVGA